ncbi:TylF/MycF family methyltransferase [bacterium]|nr:TylF/MycF family methyltransferase [bacterium]
MGIDKKNIKMIKGWFQNTLPEYKNKIGKISLLRIDADWYESTKCCLENLYDNVIDEGFVVIDDYGTCFGAKKALDEFLEKKNYLRD